MLHTFVLDLFPWLKSNIEIWLLIQSSCLDVSIHSPTYHLLFFLFTRKILNNSSLIFNNSFYFLFNMVIINVVIDYKRNIIMMEEKLFHLSLSMRFFFYVLHNILISEKIANQSNPFLFFCYIVSLNQNISTSLLNSVITKYRSLYIRYQVTIKILLLKYKPALRLLSFNKCEEINHSLIE